MRDDSSFSDWRDKVENWRLLRHKKLPVNVPGIAQVLEERSPLIETHGQRYANRLDAAKMKLEVAPRSSDNAAVEAALRIEAFDFAIYHEFREQPNDPFRRRTDSTVFYAIGLLHLTFKKGVRERLLGKRLPDIAEVKKLLDKAEFKENIFQVEAPSLAATFWERNFSAVCEIGEQPIAHWAAEALEDDDKELLNWLTSETLEEGSGRPNVVKHYHLETTEFIYDVLEHPTEGKEKLMLEYRPTIVGRPWYTFAVGHLTSDEKPDESYMPVIHAVYPIVQLINILETLVNSGALQTGRNMWQQVPVGKPVDHYADILVRGYEQDPDIRLDPFSGEGFEAKPGHEWKTVPVPDQSQLITALQNKKEELLDQGFPIALLPGQPEQQRASSGYQAANEQQAAITQLDPPLRNIASADRQLFILIHDIIGKEGLNIPISLPVHMGGDRNSPAEVTTIKPEDVREVDLTVTYESIPETARFAIIESLERQVQAGRTPRSKLMAFLHDNPILADERITQEKIAAASTQMAVDDAIALVQEGRGTIMREEAANAGLPLPPPPGGAAGGPAPGQENRQERPVDGSFPGLGAPAVPPVQVQPGQVVPPDVGAGLAAQTGG